MADWQVLVTDHHRGYIEWDEYLHNRQVLAENANMRGEIVRGAVRSGSALLAGLLYCGHCRRRLIVGTSGPSKGSIIVPLQVSGHRRGTLDNRSGVHLLRQHADLVPSKSVVVHAEGRSK